MKRLRQMVRLLLHLEDTPNRVAIAFGIGLFIAFFPLLGIHTGLALEALASISAREWFKSQSEAKGEEGK